MLHANVHAFFDVTISNHFVNNDTHSVRGHIVNNSGPSVGCIENLRYLRC